jgi:hypothetical protein
MASFSVVRSCLESEFSAFEVTKVVTAWSEALWTLQQFEFQVENFKEKRF